MRDFYKQILSRTYEIFGVNQLEKMDDDQIKFLLDALENVSELYNYISPENQQKIINKRMVTDREYRNINARLIAGWFELDGKIFFKETAHTPTESAPPLEGEERDRMLEVWKAEVAKANNSFIVRPVSQGELIRESLRQNLSSPNEEPIKKSSPDSLVMHELHKQWIKENFDAMTAQPKENFMEEKEWLKQNYPEI